MAEKNDKDPNDKPLTIVIIFVGIILIGVIIAIPLIYVNGRHQEESVDQNITNISAEYVKNECTQTMSSVTAIKNLSNEEPFPYKFHSYLYRPSVILKKVALIFGFNHDNNSWSLDLIKFVDTTTKTDLIHDGNFEENYLRKYYYQCILSNTRSSISDILFDIPYEQDFYYNDQTKVGMTYLIQDIDVTGGRYYNISFYLENRGYKNNSFVLLVGALN